MDDSFKVFIPFHSLYGTSRCVLGESSAKSSEVVPIHLGLHTYQWQNNRRTTVGAWYRDLVLLIVFSLWKYACGPLAQGEVFQSRCDTEWKEFRAFQTLLSSCGKLFFLWQGIFYQPFSRKSLRSHGWRSTFMLTDIPSHGSKHVSISWQFEIWAALISTVRHKTKVKPFYLFCCWTIYLLKVILTSADLSSYS